MSTQDQVGSVEKNDGALRLEDFGAAKDADHVLTEDEKKIVKRAT